MRLNDDRPRPKTRPHLQECAHCAKIVVSRALGVSMEDISAPTRSKAQVAFARQAAMYLCHVVCGMSLSEVGFAFGRDRTTVSHACHLIEDRRDCEDLDRLLELAETRLRDFLDNKRVIRDRSGAQIRSDADLTPSHGLT